MLFRSIITPGLCLAMCFPVAAQLTAPANGPRDRAVNTVALTRATVHPAPGERLRDAVVLIEDDRIVAVGRNLRIPAHARVLDLNGAHVWPGFIDPYSAVGMPPKEPARPRDTPGYWNRAVRATQDAALLWNPSPAVAPLRAQGFTTVLVHDMDGVVRGSGCAISLAGRSAAEDVLQPATAMHFSFRKGSSPDAYPGSLMGSIALLRQVLLDAQWYAAGGDGRHVDPQLEALAAQLNGPVVFEAEDREDVLRAARIAKEFGLRPIMKGVGDEYLRLADILATGAPLIVPLALPAPFEVEDPFDALEVSLGELKHWELAPSNPARIAEAGGTFAFTTHGMEDPAAMWTSLRRMVRQGLDTAAAVAALTTVPAKLFGLQDRVGALRPGMRADLVITDKHLLHPANVVHETWVGGQRTVHVPMDRVDLRGDYDINIAGRSLRLSVKGKPEAPDASVRSTTDTVRHKAEISLSGPVVSLRFPGTPFGWKGTVRLSGTVYERSGIWEGQGQLPDEAWVPWSAIKQKGGRKEEGRPERADQDSLWSTPVGEVWYPSNAFGATMLPDTQAVLFRNATIWTNGPQGILRDADICIHGGRVLAVGQGLRRAELFPRGRVELLEVDAKGKHITSGIIDEHSHIAIARGVNEGAQAITSEVRIGDVIDPDAVDIHRALAGGVTAVHQLHGSANPIGGQSSLIKLRYGRGSDALRFAEAPGSIKFALGENVKRSNWGDRSRYPQTRMGVEQVFRDAFIRARDHAAEQARYRSMKPKERAAVPPFRRDLELEALAEVLAGQRHITCHSYVRSEILMLMRVADSLGFKVNTFTHILEGYKVARKLKAHGATASTFSDWWAYKAEVDDAIPYNAALLHAEGVNVCINSDDAEMGRRLNQEAAKVVKYGGVPPEEAWKMVTLNPAKALHVDHRTGALLPGLDADLVVWSADPLSIGAKAERVYVDGVPYYDQARVAEQEARVQAERSRIVAKMLAARQGGDKARKPRPQGRRHVHCDTIEEQP